MSRLGNIIVAVVIFGILAAIVVPNYIKYQLRARQAEVKTNLKEIVKDEKVYFFTRDSYSPFIQEIGFDPERRNRYCYDLSAGDGWRLWQDRSKLSQSRDPMETSVTADTFAYSPETGIRARMSTASQSSIDWGPAGAFTAVAAGIIDEDVDPWSVSSRARGEGCPSSSEQCSEGNNPAGEPCNDEDACPQE